MSILRIFYYFVQFLFILGPFFGGEGRVKPNFADKNFYGHPDFSETTRKRNIRDLGSPFRADCLNFLLKRSWRVIVSCEKVFKRSWLFSPERASSNLLQSAPRKLYIFSRKGAFFCNNRLVSGGETLKTLTSLTKEVRPFFQSDNSIWSFHSFSSLSDYSIYGGPASYFCLAIIALGAFEFIVPKCYSRLGKMDKRSLGSFI